MDSIDTVCVNLEKAFKEHGDDPVTLATIIDMYVSQISEEDTRENKQQFLSTLLEQLKAHPGVVGSIGWDLPKDLLKFYNNKSVTVYARLNSNPIVGLVMKCFNEVALAGNPKECLLTGCELLSDLTATRIAEQLEEDDEEHSQDETEDQSEQMDPHRDPVEFFLLLNSYVLFELIQTVLKRISSLYPSKFLGMAVSAISKFVRANIDDISNSTFLLRRIYTFCKSYIPPEVPKEMLEDEKLKKEDLDRIAEDEATLQGQLLRNLCAFAMGYCLKNKATRLDLEYYHSLRNTEYKMPELSEELLAIGKRFYQLTFAFDLDIRGQFINYIKETKAIYKALPPDSEIPNEDARRAIGQVVYQLAYTYQLQKLTKLKHLELNPSGIFNLSGLHYEETKKHLYPEITIVDAIYLYIRCTTPSLFSQTYNNEYAKGTARYWVWVAITNNSLKDLTQQMSELPSYIRTVFLQMILLQNCNQANEETRMITFTLLTRIMCLMPEDTSFDFVLDTLLTCPFTHAKIAVLGILKDLMLRNCQSKQSLEEQLANLDLQPKEATKSEKPSPPSLPPRPYVDINTDRMASIHSVAIMAIQDDKSKGKDRDILILNFLNFFNGLSQKWDRNLLQDIHSHVASQYNERTEETIPEIGFIKIANDTLKKRL